MSPTKKDSSKSSSKQRSVTFDKKTKNGESKRERASTDQPQLQQHERHQVLMDPPSFRLPSLSNEENPNRYELWTVRLPAGLNLQDLQGVNLRHDETLESDGSKYLVQLGHGAENESFRVLVPEDTASNDREQNSDDDSDDSEGTNNKNKTKSSKRHHKQQRLMVPVPRPLARHWNVVQHTVLSEAEVAPRADQAPTPCVPLRHAYSHVPQKENLKRRWMPPGSCQDAAAAAGTTAMVSRPKNGTTTILKAPPSSDEDDDNDVRMRTTVKVESPAVPAVRTIKQDEQIEDSLSDPAVKGIKLEDSNSDEIDSKPPAVKLEEHAQHRQSDSNNNNNSQPHNNSETKEERKARRAAKKAKKEKKKIKEEELS